jgi:hypothetical protein
MKIIAHRGNLNGKSTNENHPDQIKKALDMGFDVEIDVWHKDNLIYLGHDFPEYEVKLSWLNLYKNFFWIHLKNVDCYDVFLNTDFNYFWHENDKFTLTSKCIPWCYPKIYLKNGVTVLLDKQNISKDLYGICTDYPIYWMKNFKNV